MNKETFTAIKRTTGYSTSDLSDYLSVSERTVDRWSNAVGELNVPSRVENLMNDLYATYVKNVQAGTQKALDTLESFSDNPIENSVITFTLRVYNKQVRELNRPYLAINAETYGVANNLLALGFKVTFTSNKITDDFLPFADYYVVTVGVTERSELIDESCKTLEYNTIDEAYDAYNKIDPRSLFIKDLATKNSIDDMRGLGFAVYLDGVLDNGDYLGSPIDYKKYTLSDYIHESKN